MSSLSQFFSPAVIAVGIAMALVGFAVGYAISRIAGERLKRETERLGAEIARLEIQGREQARQVHRLRNDQRWLSNLSRFLPNVVRDLNRSDLDPREIPRLLFSLVDAVFEPEQIVLFKVKKGDASEGPSLLYLSEQRGLSDAANVPRRVRPGEGKIGWVAEAKVEMATEDWLNLTRTEGRALEDNHPALRLDLVGPILHHEQGDNKLLGVLCVGGPSIRPRDEKLMLQMITNLAAIATVNTENHRILNELANHDGLTALLNKRYFMKERLGLMIHAAEREAQRVGVFIFDIDHFKKYNDTNGHVAGDEILRRVAQVLRDNLRPNDVACRYGGEEFIVAMPRTNGPDALQAAERIRKAIESHPFPLRETQPLGSITISGGVAVFPVNGVNGNDLVRHADEALYRAKAAGRNQVLLYRGVDIGDGAEPGDAPAWATESGEAAER